MCTLIMANSAGVCTLILKANSTVVVTLVLKANSTVVYILVLQANSKVKNAADGPAAIHLYFVPTTSTNETADNTKPH